MDLLFRNLLFLQLSVSNDLFNSYDPKIIILPSKINKLSI